jgi:hypothetical protein
MVHPRLFRAGILVLLIGACHQPSPDVPGQAGVSGDATGVSGHAETVGISSQLADSVIGVYSGHYSKGLITLAINYLSGNIASGYDIHKGLRRNLNGKVERKNGRLELVLKEPGGNPYDGTFFISYDIAAARITGKWIPFDPKLAVEGPLEVARFTAENSDIGSLWRGDLGTMNFLHQGVCTLEYYPDGDSLGIRDPNAQLVIIRGSYEIKGDTVWIDWQRNNRTPAVNMKLLFHQGHGRTDSTIYAYPSLEGNGVRFEGT